MKFIFCKLPNDIIKHILSYDEHFIIRKGEIISIIPKTDYRYNLLNSITFNLGYIEKFNNNESRYNYYFPNLHNYEERTKTNSDLIQVSINEQKKIIKYSIWIGRQYPKSIKHNKKQDYYIENELDYNWIYTEYQYIRR